MVKLYVAKIQNKEINPLTGNIWAVEDVPTLWRDKVQEALDAENETVSQESGD